VLAPLLRSTVEPALSQGLGRLPPLAALSVCGAKAAVGEEVDE
jgi:hypothetical protein